MYIETDAPDDREGTLELHGGAIQIAVFFTLNRDEEEPLGYLRVAFGQGNAVNRILTSQGTVGQITTDAGDTLSIRIFSVEPSEAPGYLCSFSLQEAGVETPLAQAA